MSRQRERAREQGRQTEDVRGWIVWRREERGREETMDGRDATSLLSQTLQSSI